MLDAGESLLAIPASRAPSDVKTAHILTTFPFIGKLNLKHNLDTDMNSETCVYANGLALYTDSQTVLERAAELYQGRTNVDEFRRVDIQLESQHTRPTDLGERNSARDERSSICTAMSRSSTSNLSDETILSTSASLVEDVPDWTRAFGSPPLKNNASW